MKYDEFIGHVQNRAALSSRGDAERLTRVVLENLGARLQTGEADDLASQLPRELGRHLLTAPMLEKFDLNEMFRRVAESEGVDQAEAAYRTRVVMEVLMEATSIGEIKDVLDQLPRDFSRLFVGAKGPLPSQEVPYDQIRRIQESLHAQAREKAAKARGERERELREGRTEGAREEEGRWEERRGEQVRGEEGRWEEARGEQLNIERSQDKWEEAYPGGESRGRQEQGSRSRGDRGR